MEQKQQKGSPTTFLKIGNENDGFIEIDLISFRERGEEQRYLALKTIGLDIEKEPPVAQNTIMSITSKEEFEKLKLFFAQLDWND